VFYGTSIQNELIRAEVLMDGVAQPLYLAPTLGRVFVVGQPGQTYALRVQALRPGRVEVLCAIDGLNTLKDEPAYLDGITGMVFSGSYTFVGWRTSRQEVRPFVFGDPAQSFAAQATGGDTSNNGVIGFAAFAEQYVPPVAYRTSPAPYPGVRLEMERSSRAAGGMFDAGSGALGTGGGAPVFDQVGSTHFQRRGDQPQVLEIGYDTQEALNALGILGPGLPKAFPDRVTGYARFQ